jgi:hypothetical protein
MHPILRTCSVLLVLALGFADVARASEDRSAEVMVVGVYHMANPAADLHNMKADDVLSPARQAEVVAVTERLANFRPTKVAVERSPGETRDDWSSYRAGALPPSPSEVVQLGFRLAKTAGSEVYGIDADGEFPYEPVKDFADAHGQAALLDAQGAAIEKANAELASSLANHGVAAALRNLNAPAWLAVNNAAYRTMLRVGAGDQQPGADLLTAWYRRNFLICANLIQHIGPGDRVVVFYGAGHAYLLRQCVIETPGLELVEPADYLP